MKKTTLSPGDLRWPVGL